MGSLAIPDRKDVSELNQRYFDYFMERLNGVPNLYAMLAYSESALATFYKFQHRQSSLSIRESEAMGLLIAEENGSAYCLSSHAMSARLNGFSEEEISQIRQGIAPFDNKLHALLQLLRDLIVNKGTADDLWLEKFFEAGYSRENLIDTLLVIGENFICNYTANALAIPPDSPTAEKPGWPTGR